MLTVLASLFLYPASQTWNAGELTVEVNKASNSWRILLPDSTEVYHSRNIESIAYILLKDKELTLTGTKQGRTFFTKLTTNNNSTVHLETSFLSDRTKTANHLLEEFTIPNTIEVVQTGAGLAPDWKTPYLLYSSQTASIAMWPDFANWNLMTPMLADMLPGRIGYQNASPTEIGNWARNEAERPVPTNSQVSFYIQAKPREITKAELKSELWAQAVRRFRAQAYPQQVPMIAAASLTFKFDRYPAQNLFDTPDTTVIHSSKRWETLGEPNDEEGHAGGEEEEERGIEDKPGTMGLPGDQHDTITLNSKINALRVATAMYSWGNAKQQNDWKVYSKQLTSLIIAGSPENGFSSKIVTEEDGPETPKPTTVSASTDEIATAFFAARLLAEFPDHPLAEQLTDRIVGVLKRIGTNQPTPEASALIASVSAHESLAPEVRQLAVENLIPLQSTFVINDKNRDNPWTLETLYWLHHINPNLYSLQVNQLVNQFLDQQSVVDNRTSDRLAAFGAFRTTTGAISAETANLASIIGRLGIAMNQPEWLDRAAFALRSLHNLYPTTFETTVPELIPEISTGTSSPGFGNIIRNQADPRVNFEGSEGLLNAATWEILQQCHGAYIFPDGQAVGFDGLATTPDNQVRNSMFGNPTPFAKAFQEGVKTANKNYITPAETLAPFPTISRLIIELRGKEFYVVASPGLSLDNSAGDATGSFYIGSKKQASNKGADGFESKLKDIASSSPIEFIGRNDTAELYAKSALPEGSPVSWATSSLDSWYRSGDYRWSGSPSIIINKRTWLSTGDLGNGTEAKWMTGLYYTPWLNVIGKSLEFSASGTGDCRIMLVDEFEHTTLETWFPQDNDSNVKFDLSALSGRRVKVVIQDRDPNGLVRVTNLRVTN